MRTKRAEKYLRFNCLIVVRLRGRLLALALLALGLLLCLLLELVLSHVLGGNLVLLRLRVRVIGFAVRTRKKERKKEEEKTKQHPPPCTHLDDVGAADAGSLDLGAAGVGLVVEELGTGAVSLGLVDVLHHDTLVLEDVTLALEVELMVEVAVNLLGSAVAAEQAAEDALAPHPDDLDGHAGVGRTLAFSDARVTTLAACFEKADRARTRVHNRGLLDDEAVGDHLAHALACKGGVSKPARNWRHQVKSRKRKRKSVFDG
jgi:hypothetical protein